jgi:hypothetical protein
MKTMKPNDFGKPVLVEECQKIRISDFLKEYRAKLKILVIQAEIEELGLKIDLAPTKTGFGGVRQWFVCPLCKKRAGTLFLQSVKNIIGCRTCLGLKYQKNRYRGMIEEACFQR